MKRWGNRQLSFLLSAAVVSGLVTPTIARAEPPLVSAEMDAAGPVTEPQTRWFTWGLSGAATVLGDPIPQLQPGIRIRALRVFDAEPPRGALNDPDGGGLYTLSGVLRIRPLAHLTERRGSGLFIDLAAGPGVTGELVRFTAEGGLGYLFDIGPVNVGPAVRYQHVLQNDDSIAPDDAGFLHFGIEVQLFDADPPPELRTPHPLPPPDKPETEPEPQEQEPCPAGPEDEDGFQDDDNCLDADNDGDGIPDVRDECPNEPETKNGVNDHDGCPDSGEMTVSGDRLTIDEEVFFDFDKAAVRESGWDKLREVKELWDEHPEWAGMRVEGHADSRGTQAYNQELSEERAEAVKEVLVSLGMDGDYINTRGYGEPPARRAGETPEEYQENRRVDFVVIGGGQSGTNDTSDGQPPTDAEQTENQ